MDGNGNGGFELDLEAIRAAYDNRNNSDAAYEAYRDLMYTSLERLIYFLAKKWTGKAYGNQLATFNDLVQDAVVALMEDLPNYNPYISQPSTYFLPRFEAKMKKSLNNFSVKITDYYREMIAQTDTVLKESGFSTGINDPTITIDLISQVMNIPVKTAKMVYELARREYSNLEDPSYLEKTDISTEEKAIHAQEVAALVEQCDKLTPFEKFVFSNKLYEGVSYRTLVTILKQNEELLKKFSLDRKQVTGKFVKQIEARAIRKLRAGSNHLIAVKVSTDIYIQASNDDIDDYINKDDNPMIL